MSVGDHKLDGKADVGSEEVVSYDWREVHYFKAHCVAVITHGRRSGLQCTRRVLAPGGCYGFTKETPHVEQPSAELKPLCSQHSR